MAASFKLGKINKLKKPDVRGEDSSRRFFFRPHKEEVGERKARGELARTVLSSTLPTTYLASYQII